MQSQLKKVALLSVAKEAIALGKSLGISLPLIKSDARNFGSTNDKASWRKTLELYKNQMKYNQLIGQMKGHHQHSRIIRQLPVGLAKERDEHVALPYRVAEPVQTPKAVTTFQIGVDNSLEPPKLIRNDLTKVPLLRQLDDYEMSFQPILTNDVSRIPVVISGKPLRLIEVDPIGGTEKYLNYILRKLRTYPYYADRIILRFIPRIKKKQRVAKAKESLTFNCVLQPIQEWAHASKSLVTRVNREQAVKAMNDKYFADGVGEKEIKEICEKLEVNIIMYSAAQNIWFEYCKNSKRKTFFLVNHNGHATSYEKRYTEETLPGSHIKIKAIEYCDNVNTHFHTHSPTLLKYPTVDNNFNITSYKTDCGTIYKSRSIFWSEADFKKNSLDLELANVHSLTARYFKEKQKEYDIQMYWNDKDLYNFVKAADHHNKAWSRTTKYWENSYSIDQTRAYNQYLVSEYYAHYQFPRQPTHFYKVSKLACSCEYGFPDCDNCDNTNARKAKILKLSGFVQIDNVDIPALPELEYLWRTSYPQNMGVYFTPELVYLASLGVTFDIIAVAYSHTKQKIDFTIDNSNWEEFNYTEMYPPQKVSLDASDVSFIAKQKKKIECEIMGFLIPNPDKEMITAVHAANPIEFKQLRFELSGRITNLDEVNNIIYYSVPKSQQKLRGAHHVHAAILAYQQIQFLKTALTIDFRDILKVKVDCIITREPVEQIDLELWHREDSIKAIVTPNISSINFNRHSFTLDRELSELHPAVLRSQFIEITGDAGCGKTYFSVNRLNLYDVCVAVPTHVLRIKFITENPEIPCETFHKLFSINQKKGSYEREVVKYSNYIVDESSMICKGLMNRILTHKYLRDGNIVVIHDKAQLAPVMPNSADWDDKSDPYFTNGIEYKSRNWCHIHLTEQMRQNGDSGLELLRRLTLLRTMTMEYRNWRPVNEVEMDLKEKLSLFKDRVITRAQLLSKYNFDTADVILAAKHVTVDKYNDLLNSIAPAGKIKTSYERSTKTQAQGHRLINQTSLGTNQVLGYAATVHCMQGRTFIDNIFISMSSLNFDPHLLYTAASRAKSLDQIFLIE